MKRLDCWYFTHHSGGGARYCLPQGGGGFPTKNTLNSQEKVLDRFFSKKVGCLYSIARLIRTRSTAEILCELSKHANYQSLFVHDFLSTVASCLQDNHVRIIQEVGINKGQINPGYTVKVKFSHHMVIWSYVRKITLDVRPKSDVFLLMKTTDFNEIHRISKPESTESTLNL